MDPVPAPATADLLDDLATRLRATRRIPLPEGVGWSRGTDADYLTDLLASWVDFDWRAQEERLRALPWVRTGTVECGLRSIRTGAAGAAPTVVLLHGWPDSFLRFERVLPLLGDLDVVVPCLPGYPYADVLTTPGMSAAQMARVVAGSLAELGVERYVVSGGDVGSSVAEHLAAQQPEHVAALHLTDVPYTHLFSVDPDQLSAPERDFLAAGQRWQMSEGAYALEQTTKPHTLAAGLGDSPVGLAAWIVEKLRGWSDCGGDVETVWSREEVLTWITLYWVTGSIGTSFSPYVDHEQGPDRVDVPTAVTVFPHDLVPAPRVFGERFFDVRSWDERPSGGHFGAWEQPEAFAAGLRTAVGLS
jgi:pimeloyl-ACP methyl ester carboxylesterase